ncbi:MAG: ribonuclease J [Eggerthellaceae bacterium]|nr:ribonuclease J [Eggerthellaceae bacterium]
MADSDNARTPRRRRTAAPSNGKAQNNGQDKQSQQGQQQNNQKKKRGTQSVKFVKLEKERPALTRDISKGEQKKAHRKRGSSGEGKKQGAQLKVIPLGGLDAIGKNMTVFECGNDIVLDDAGLMFPDDDHPGIDLILPDYTYVLEHADKLRGIVITHGHEDHTGSLPYLYKDLDKQVPIYGTKMTLGLIEGKFAEHRIKNAKLVEIKPGDKINLGCIEAEFFAVNHSIPGAVGVFFRSPAGNVLHTGDFKLDQSPIDGVHTDFAALARFGDEGVDLMLSDSTNANNPNFTKSESEVGKTLSKIIAQAQGRVVIASFASHIHRMQQICDAAVANGRKVVVTGRSMIQNTDIARKLGYLSIDDKDLVDAYELSGIPPEKIVVMCTGSQGEPLSALSRIAGGLHKTIEIDEGDTVIISATPVPGNEKAVTRVINMLSKIGADVYDKSRALVHVSGHAGAEELKLVLSITHPRAFMPVHGEATHLRAHAALAEQTGVPADNIFICENGESLVLDASGVQPGEHVQSGVVYVDGLSVGDTSQDVLDERVTLGAQGFAALSAAVSMSERKLAAPVSIEMHGITGGDDPYVAIEAQEAVETALKRQLGKGATAVELRKVGRDTLLNLLWERTKQRPMAIATILEV